MIGNPALSFFNFQLRTAPPVVECGGVPVTDGSSFGGDLRRERELREVSLQEIAEATKISIKFLHAIEENQFDVLPGGVFNVGFIRAYAKYIGVDDDEMVNNYLFHMQQLKQEEGEDSETGATMGSSRPFPDRRAVWLVAVVLVIAAAGVASWYFFLR
jgi:cytoskeleton protein RodZ